jgi:hypothetical protein
MDGRDRSLTDRSVRSPTAELEFLVGPLRDHPPADVLLWVAVLDVVLWVAPGLEVFATEVAPMMVCSHTQNYTTSR